MPFSPPKDSRDIQSLLQIMDNLRTPEGGCPWDVAQSHASIARYALEEAYEVVDAIDRQDDQDLRDELGDLLLQVVFHAQMAKERGAFDFADVVSAIGTKMVRRHPHVFADAAERDADTQTIAWEEIKAAERAEKAAGAPDRIPSLLDDVPVGLPALTRAEKLGKRAARAGFDWPSTAGVIAKIREELDEVEDALAHTDQAHLEEELGDLLFSVANLTRYLKVDGETVLRACNAKFIRRFEAVEAGVAASDKTFKDHTLAELEAYWHAAKMAE